MKNIMTVKELYDRIILYTKDTPEVFDHVVVVQTSDHGFPSTPTVGIKAAFPGFDWDHGKLILQTSSKIKQIK